MTRRAQKRVTERLALGAGLVCAVLLAAPPNTRANSALSAALVPWPVGSNPTEIALSGGLSLLRAKGSRMIRVPASDFFMGSSESDVVDATLLCEREPLATTCDEQTFANELSRHHVKLSGFFLDRTEVTVADYDACARVGRCKAPPYEQGARRFQRASFPVTLVTWDDARSFCEFRGARLPTEAEFERAARGRTGRRFPWGEYANGHLANHGRLGLDLSDASDGFAELAPVGSFRDGRTPDGFLDLAGNVAEWVQDRYATQYPDQELSDPQGPDAATATSARVVRGGSYESPIALLRGAARGAFLPNERRPSLGFRCARSQRGRAVP
ncbi:MAG TPA: formylglycine-generating enzyme family protein [Polyangiaceae bacterium]|nr:formylglycine-generating enzyme family protein [Polyangiaceae bacterium]